jgi:hypothetical protein
MGAASNAVAPGCKSQLFKYGHYRRGNSGMAQNHPSRQLALVAAKVSLGASRALAAAKAERPLWVR